MNRTLTAVMTALLLTLGGCATFYQSIGVATTADIAARDEKLAALENRFQEVASRVDSTAATAQKLSEESKAVAEKAAEVEGLMRDLQGRVSQLPQETLRRLAEILTRAAQESAAP